MSDLDASLTKAWLITHREETDGRPLFDLTFEPSAQLLRVLESSTRKARRHVNLIVRSRKQFPLAFIMNGIHPCQWIAIAACIAVVDSSFGGDVPVMIPADLRNPLLVVTGSPHCQPEWP